MNDSIPFADLRFSDGELYLPQETATIFGTQYILYFPLQQYRDFIDLLRHEKPLYFFWGGQSGQSSFLGTYQEIVGEEESSG